MSDEIKVVMTFPRAFVEKAFSDCRVIGVGILPACSELMLRKRERITVVTGAPKPDPDEVLAYINRFVDERYRADLIMDYSVHDVGIVQILERIAEMQGVQPYDVAQGMCMGVPLSDTEFQDYLDDAKKNGVTHIDPRALIYTSTPLTLDGNEVDDEC